MLPFKSAEWQNIPHRKSNILNIFWSLENQRRHELHSVMKAVRWAFENFKDVDVRYERTTKSKLWTTDYDKKQSLPHFHLIHGNLCTRYNEVSSCVGLPPESQRPLSQLFVWDFWILLINVLCSELLGAFRSLYFYSLVQTVADMMQLPRERLCTMRLWFNIIFSLLLKTVSECVTVWCPTNLCRTNYVMSLMYS